MLFISGEKINYEYHWPCYKPDKKEIMMRKTAKILLAITAMLSIPAAAQAQTYVGISGGLTLPSDSKNKGEFTANVPATATAGAIPSGTSLEWKTEFDKGYNISGQVGYRLNGGLRAEAELFYTRNGIKRHSGLTVGGANIDGVGVSVLTRGTPAATDPTVGALINSGIGSAKTYGAFANVYYDLIPEGKFSPYVGAGIGLARNRVNYRPSNVAVGKGSETNLAYQFAAGATYKASDNFEIFGQYNYRDFGKNKLALSLLPADLGVKNKQSVFSLGVRIPFGGE
jgi:opacity protein-like surface antigen